MKTYYKIGIAFAFLLVNGCGQSNGDLKTNIYDNDFETIGYWTEDRVLMAKIMNGILWVQPTTGAKHTTLNIIPIPILKAWMMM